MSRRNSTGRRVAARAGAGLPVSALLCALLLPLLSVPAAAFVAPQDTSVHAKERPAAVADNASAADVALLQILEEELAYTMEHLSAADGTRPYYVAYTVTDSEDAGASASLGALQGSGRSRQRVLDVDVRVGDYQLDNTHKLRREFSGFGSGGGGSNVSRSISLADDDRAIRQVLWLATDQAFKAAVQQHQNVLTNLKAMVEEEDQSGDFTREEPSRVVEPPVSLDFDLDAWSERVRGASEAARQEPLVYDSSVGISAGVENRTMVTSEGTRLRTTNALFSVYVQASTKAEDGMELSKFEGFHAASADGLPGEAEVAAALRRSIDMALALREAPLVEPFTGPAILLNRASGVFFHEIFGHRIEGHRQRDVDEGQTFTKKLGENVLPGFLSVHDDPTLVRFGSTDLRGHYRFDDEGVVSRDVTLVDGGVLRTFLMSRQPVQDFDRSNGHGRRNPGETVVARQGNLVVSASETVPMARLRELLLAECARQQRPYGLLFEDISGGFTTTQRGGPQAFKVLPVVVWRVWADGRPDELVRGADIVGTPLACFDKIIAAGDDPDVFNGTCGAESGWVPVSAVSPSVLVSEIEIEKRQHEQDKPPLLPSPVLDLPEDQG